MDRSTKGLLEEISDIINKYSREGLSNTPDFILATYLVDVLEVFEKAVRQREEHNGRTINKK